MDSDRARDWIDGRAVRCGRSVSRPLDPQFFHFGVERCRLQSKQIGRSSAPADPPARAFKGAEDRAPLRLRQAHDIQRILRGN
jgi:hypothetical protein